MAKQKRIFREHQHPRDARGRFARRGSPAWVARASESLRASGDLSALTTRGEGGRPRIARAAKAGALLQAHTDGGRPSPVRVPKAVKTAAPTVNTERFMSRDATAAVSAPAPGAPGAPRKRMPRPSPAAAALIAARQEEQAPHTPAMVAARTAAAEAPVPGADNYRAMRRHTLISLARNAKIPVRGKSNDDLANALARHDEETKAQRAAHLNPTAVGARVDTPSDNRQGGGMTSTTSGRALHEQTLRDQFGVNVQPTDTDEEVAKALETALRARPSDSVVDAQGLGAARIQAGTNAANMSLVMARHRRGGGAASTTPATGPSWIVRPYNGRSDTFELVRVDPDGTEKSLSRSPRRLALENQARDLNAAEERKANPAPTAPAATAPAAPAASARLSNEAIMERYRRAADRVAQLDDDDRDSRASRAAYAELRAAREALADVEPSRAALGGGADTAAPGMTSTTPEAPQATPPNTDHLKRPKARKGDLVVVEETSSSYVLGEGTRESTDVRVGVVTSTDRDGRVTGWSTNADGSYPQKVTHRQKTYKLEAERVDVPAAMQAARENRWPGGQEGRPFSSVDAAREAVRPHVGDQAAKLKTARAAAPKGRDPMKLQVGDRVTIPAFRQGDPPTIAEVTGPPEAVGPSIGNRNGGVRVPLRIVEGPNAGREGGHTFKKSDKAQVLPSAPAEAAPAPRAATTTRGRIPQDAKRTVMARDGAAVDGVDMTDPQRWSRSDAKYRFEQAAQYEANGSGGQSTLTDDERKAMREAIGEFNRIPSWETQRLDAAARRVQRFRDLDKQRKADFTTSRNRMAEAARARGSVDREAAAKAEVKRLKKENGIPGDAKLKTMPAGQQSLARSIAFDGANLGRLRAAVENNRNSREIVTAELARTDLDPRTRAEVEKLLRNIDAGASPEGLARAEAELQAKIDVWNAVRAAGDGDPGPSDYNFEVRSGGGLSREQADELTILGRQDGTALAERAAARLRGASSRPATTTRGRIPRNVKEGMIADANAKAASEASAASAKAAAVKRAQPKTKLAADATPAEPQPTYRVQRQEIVWGRGELRHELIRTDPDGTEVHLGTSTNAGELTKRMRALQAEQGPVIPSAKLEKEEAKLRARLEAYRAKRVGTRRRPSVGEEDVIERLQEIAPRLARSRREERAAAERANPRGLGGMTGVDQRVIDQLVRDNLANSETADRLDQFAAEAVANGSVPPAVARAARRVAGNVDHDKAALAEYRRLLGLPTPTREDEVIEVDAGEVRFGDIVSAGGFGMQVATITGPGNAREVSGIGSTRPSVTLSGRVKVRRPKADAAPASAVAAPARARISPDAKRAANARLDTSRVSSQNGGGNTPPTTEANVNAPKRTTPGEATLGVTESSRGRTTTVTLPDGSTAQRTSKSRAYTHAIVATRDLHAEARSNREDADRLEAYSNALQAWIEAGSDLTQLRRFDTGGGSINDHQAGIRHYGYYLPGFEPVERRSKSGSRYFQETSTGPSVEHVALYRDGTPVPLKHDWEAKYHGPEYHRQGLAEARAKVAGLRKKAAAQEAGPQYEHHVARWSQSAANAFAASGSAELNYPRNTSLQVVTVGGVARPEDAKPAKRVPTLAEKAAAAEAKKAAEKADAAKRKQEFFDRTIKGVTEALANPETVQGTRSDPNWYLSLTEAALVSLAKHLGAKVPNREKTSYGTPRPHDPNMLRKLIIDAVRARSAEAPQAATPAAPAAQAIPDPPNADLRERLERFTPAERDRMRAEAAQIRANQQNIGVSAAWRGVIEGAEQDRMSNTGAYSRTGPGAVPVGGTDADRRAARPRLENETDQAYEIRTAPTRDAALRLLNGHQAAGLRSMARREGIVTSGSKADLVARLIRVMRDRHEDSAAIDRMVNGDRTPAAPAQAAPDTPTGGLAALQAIPEAGRRISGREPVTDTVARLLDNVRNGGMTRERAADLIAQLVQRFSINRGAGNATDNERIADILGGIARSLRQAAPAPTMTGSQLLAARRAASPKA